MTTPIRPKAAGPQEQPLYPPLIRGGPPYPKGGIDYPHPA